MTADQQREDMLRTSDAIMPSPATGPSDTKRLVGGIPRTRIESARSSA